MKYIYFSPYTYGEYNQYFTGLQVVWKQVIWGTAMQFIFGLIVLRWDVGRNIIDCLGQKVTTFLGYTDVGSGFVYGYLVTDANESQTHLGTIFAFKVLYSFFIDNAIVVN